MPQLCNVIIAIVGRIIEASPFSFRGSVSTMLSHDFYFKGMLRRGPATCKLQSRVLGRVSPICQACGPKALDQQPGGHLMVNCPPCRAAEGPCGKPGKGMQDNGTIERQDSTVE